MNDQQILTVLRSQNPNPAIKEIYGLFPQIKKFLLKQGAEKSLIKDVFQEAIIIFYDKAKAPQFELNCSISTYLHAVSRNLFLKSVRDSKETPMGEIQSDATSEETLDWDEPHRDVFQLMQGVLNDLGHRCLELLQGFYFERRSMKELTESLQFANPNAAKRKKYKCMERAKVLAHKRLSNQKIELL